MEVTFEKDGRRMILIGSPETRICKMITGRKLQKVLKSKWTQVAQLFSIEVVEHGEGDAEQEEAGNTLQPQPW